MSFRDQLGGTDIGLMPIKKQSVVQSYSDNSFFAGPSTLGLFNPLKLLI